MRSTGGPRRRPSAREAALFSHAGSAIHLREILLDIAEDSPDTAERLRSENYGVFQRLARSPGMGHYHEELLDRRYRFWNFYSYVVCYAWEQKPIRIVAVVHGARDLGSFFSSTPSPE